MREGRGGQKRKKVREREGNEGKIKGLTGN